MCATLNAICQPAQSASLNRLGAAAGGIFLITTVPLAIVGEARPLAVLPPFRAGAGLKMVEIMVKAKQPRFLVLVTGKDGAPRLFSAHLQREAAVTMMDSLDGLTASIVTLLEVPKVEGIMKTEPCDKPTHDDVPAFTQVKTRAATQAIRAPDRKKTPEQIEAETARALSSQASVIISDALDDDDEAFS